MSRFVHRDNYPLASYDSICMRCFATVGTRQAESELAEDEAAHVCSEADLRRISRVQSNKPD